MSDILLKALQELFVGQILKCLDGKNLGMRVHRIEYDSKFDMLMMSVYYLELKEDTYYSDRDMLLIRFEDFISGFAFWQNQENPDVTKAIWKPLSEIIKYG